MSEQEDFLKFIESLDVSITLPLPPGVKRQPQGPNDFGDEDTVGVYVKRWPPPEGGNWCGRYLGRRDGQYLILILWRGLTSVREIAVYDSLEELKQQWTLD